MKPSFKSMLKAAVLGLIGFLLPALVICSTVPKPVFSVTVVIAVCVLLAIAVGFYAAFDMYRVKRGAGGRFVKRG